MAEPLKNVFTKSFVERLADALQEIVPDIDKKRFVSEILDNSWHNRELKERMRHLTVVLNSHLPGKFDKKVSLLLALISLLKANFTQKDLLGFIFLPDFIQVYGLDNYLLSIKAIETITQFITCEFAVRPFIIKYPKKMMKQMKETMIKDMEMMQMDLMKIIQVKVKQKVEISKIFGDIK